MANREFLMLAQKYNPHKYDVRGWMASEKLDGIRAFWDGGISRGILKSLVPWANNTVKDNRYVTTPVATGLWSRYGHPIMAPDWFLDGLPPNALDGELFTGRGRWQETSSYVKKQTPIDNEWRFVTFNAFDAPPLPAVFAFGRINNVQFSKEIDLETCMDFVRRKLPDYSPRFRSFTEVQALLNSYEATESFRVLPQEVVRDIDHMHDITEKMAALGAEGVMFRKPNSYWEAKRSHYLVKYKPFEDAEGVVIGFTWGRETDKGSKLLGKMGNLILDYKGKRLELSGFTDEERQCRFNRTELEYPERLARAHAEGVDQAGMVANNLYEPCYFPRGSIVTFRYRELSDDGIPKEARYLRRRDGHD